MRRPLATLAIALVATAVSAPPAGAGVLTSIDGSNFESRLHDLEPEVRGLTLEVIELGNRLELTNRSGAEVTVLGYEDEPYLRVGGDGVFTNRRSPATYLNADRRATRPVPEDATADAAPEWVRVSSGPVARWYDHRIHWMGVQDPPAVRAAPDRRHVVFPRWTVPILQGDQRIEARGELAWVPGPGLFPWLLLAAAPLGAASLFLGAAVFYRFDVRSGRPLAAASVLLLVAAVALVAGVDHRSPGLVATGAAACVAAAAAVVLLSRRRRAGVVAAAAAGVLVAALAALSLGDLARSQIPWALSPGAARALAATCLGLGAVVAVGAGLALRSGAAERGDR